MVSPPPTLSIVAPAYNEERNLPAFLAAIVPVLESIGETFEIVFVDDGSRDSTLGMLAAAAVAGPAHQGHRPRAQLRQGHRAVAPGSRTRRGRAVIPIDCDLQHPVELIPQFVAKWREGYDMVIGVRSKRDEEGLAAPHRCRARTTSVMRIDDARRDPAERRRLPADRSQDRRRHQQDAGAPPLHEGHLRVAGLQGRLDRVPGQRARERDAQLVELLQAVAVRARRPVLVLDRAAQAVDVHRRARARSARSSTA